MGVLEACGCVVLAGRQLVSISLSEGLWSQKREGERGHV